MRNKLVFAAFLSFAVALASCAKKEEAMVADNGGLVYLGVQNAVASSFDVTPDWAPKPDAMAPVDRDMLTRWSPKLGLDNEWIYFDFGMPKTMSKIIIKWEKAYAIDYSIFTSTDAKNWKRLVQMKDQDGETDEIEFRPLETRYVKIMGQKRGNPTWGFSMWELEMYGPKGLNAEGEPSGEDVSDMAEKQREFEIALKEFAGHSGEFTADEMHKGVVYTSWSDSELGSIVSDLTLVHIRRLGVKHVAIMAPTYQDGAASTVIVRHDHEGGDTPTDAAIAHAIKTCRSMGMKVLLKPHVDCMDGTFRGDIIPSVRWFESYKNMIVEYARLAEENKAEIFAVGTELEGTTFSRWEAQWRDIITAVRSVYKGHILYSANWTEYQDVPFWDVLDYVGIDAYFPLTNKKDPTREELEQAWSGVADTIGSWITEKYPDKGVIMTELGYVSSDGTNSQPWATLVNAEDQDEQAECLEAAFQVLSERPWFKGIYLWQYFPVDRWSPIGYPIRGKKAEEVLKKWYGKLTTEEKTVGKEEVLR